MFYHDPDRTRAHLIIFYRNFMAYGGGNHSHIGLGVNALHTSRVLRKHHIRCDPYGVWTMDDIRGRLQKHPTTTHVLIEAMWLSADQTATLMSEFPDVHFLIRSHSQVGFLQVEAGAVKILRDLLYLQDGSLNLTVSANSERLTTFIERTYRGRCTYLPNLYDFERASRRAPRVHDHRLLRIGSFGALRILKNHTTAAAAAMVIAENRGSDLEFWVSVHREEHGKGVLQTIRNMMDGVPGVKLVEQPWSQWPEFRRIVSHMDLCMQVSFTETFNIATADACAENVPSVTSTAIEWVPDHWKADADSVEEVARVGSALLSSRHSSEEGVASLERFCRQGTRIWLDYLHSNPV